ncbi:MAG: type IX secretion system membrane protein PorP/SprF [Bacteroidales bacterium]|nr:type IX secretion system membrane protein PorP/SprF [Bacteroidales bacterium]
MKRTVFIAMIYFGLMSVLNAQESQFSQFYSSPLYLAPSFAGATDGDRISANYRNQWPSIGNSFVTYAFSYDRYFPHLKSGLGVLFFREQAGSGSLATTNFGFQYSYNIKINEKWQIRPGLHFLYTQRSLDFNSLEFGDELWRRLYGNSDNGTIEVPTLTKKSDIDASASALAYNDSYWFGFTMDHILKPNRSLIGDNSNVPFKYTVFGGAKIPILREYNRASGQSISPAYLFKYQDGRSQLDIGCYWYEIPFVLGVWYRGVPVFKENASNDAIAFLVGYKLPNLNIGYSYDFTISKLVGYTGGAHEISFIFLFNQGVTEREKRKSLPCPYF